MNKPDALPLRILMDEGEARRVIQIAAEKRSWWIIPWVSDRTGEICTELEEKYYLGSAHDGYQVMTCPVFECGVPCVSLARKDACGPKEMAALIAKHSPPGVDENALVETLKTQDVLLFIGYAEGAPLDLRFAEARRKALLFNQWVFA